MNIEPVAESDHSAPCKGGNGVIESSKSMTGSTAHLPNPNLAPPIIETNNVTLEEVSAEHAFEVLGNSERQDDELQRANALARCGQRLGLVERRAVRPAKYGWQFQPRDGCFGKS